MLNRTLHIAVALSVLLSTTGISVHRHFCQDTAMGASWFFKARHCGMAAHKSCHTAGHCGKKSASENKCCKDKSEYHKLDQEKQLTPAQFKLLRQPLILALPWPSPRVTVVNTHREILPYLHVRPPLIRGNFQVWLQVFRF